MLKHTACFKQKQQRILKEICRKIPNVEGVIKDYEEKIVKLKKLLTLMRAIEKLSQKEKETSEEINSFNKMIAMYEEQTILLAQPENLNQTVKVDTSSNSSVPMPPVISEKAPEQIVDGSSLLQQIQKVQLKQMDKNKVEKKPAPMDKDEKGPLVFVMDSEALAKIKLKPVDHKDSVTSSHDEKKSTELEEKFAEIARRDKNNSNPVINKKNSSTDDDLKQPILRVSCEVPNSDSEKDEGNIDELMENNCHSPGFFGGSRNSLQAINKPSSTVEVQPNQIRF